jgi:hypothetical protein
MNERDVANDSATAARPAIDAGSCAQKRLTNYCAISCTTPDSGGRSRETISNFFRRRVMK